MRAMHPEKVDWTTARSSGAPKKCAKLRPASLTASQRVQAPVGNLRGRRLPTGVRESSDQATDMIMRLNAKAHRPAAISPQMSSR